MLFSWLLRFLILWISCRPFLLPLWICFSSPYFTRAGAVASTRSHVAVDPTSLACLISVSPRIRWEWTALRPRPGQRWLLGRVPELQRHELQKGACRSVDQSPPLPFMSAPSHSWRPVPSAPSWRPLPFISTVSIHFSPSHSRRLYRRQQQILFVSVSIFRTTVQDCRTVTRKTWIKMESATSATEIWMETARETMGSVLQQQQRR